MRIFAAAHPDRRERGFTLVELMVVLAVLALAATVVLLTMPGGNARVADESDRLAARMAALRDLAIVEGRPMALVISPSGYAFERRSAAGWEPLPGRGFVRRDWPSGIRWTEGGGGVRRIAFNPVGMTDARVTVRLTDGEAAASVTLLTTGEVARGQ